MTIALRDKRKRDFFWGEKSAIARMEDDAQIAVYVALLILSGEGSLIWASQDTLSSVAKVSSRTVARVLPELERLGVVRRASERTLQALAERLQEVPGTVVYELVSVESLATEQREPEDQRDLSDRLSDVPDGLSPVERKKRFVAVLVKWMRQQTGREIDFPWMIKLYERAGDETRLVSAARATVKAKPNQSVLAYMAKVLGSYQAVGPEQAELASATAEQFNVE